MRMCENNNSFWDALTARIQDRKGADRYFRKLQERSLDEVVASIQVALPTNEPPFEKALEMLEAQIDLLALSERLRRVQEHAELKTREFWLSVFDQTGIEEQENLFFDPNACSIRKKTTVSVD
jgi:hypothetical protein